MFKGEFETNALEATLHGLRDAILQQSDYHTMSQCESLEDMKAYLSSTEYNVTLNELSVLTPRALFESIQEHIVRQYNDFRNECVEPLATFLDFIAWEYMIMNVVKLLVAHQRDDLSAVKSSDNMLQRCHPMGIFAGMSMLRTSHNVDEMFEAVLLESPVGRFFRKASGKDIEELSIEFVRGILYKEWLEQFYEFCQSIGGVTAEIMGELLAFEADRFTLTVAVNTMALQGRISQEERRSLYPSIGKLAELSEALSRVDTEEELRERIKVYPEYTNMFEASRSATMAGGIGSKDHTTLESTKSIERIFREKLVEMNCNSFHQQAHLGVFYSYFKLKEMENENILWIAECISQNMKHRILDFTPIF